MEAPVHTESCHAHKTLPTHCITPEALSRNAISRSTSDIEGSTSAPCRRMLGVKTKSRDSFAWHDGEYPGQYAGYAVFPAEASRMVGMLWLWCSKVGLASV